MKIVGSGSKVLDADLLGKLAVSQASGKTVSKAEVQSAIKQAKTDLKDAFESRSSSAGLTKAQTAIANTLQLAVDSGWVKAGTSKDLIAEFIGGDKAGSLADDVEHLKLEIKSNRGSSGGRTSGGYSGRRSSSTPAPAPSRTRSRSST